MKKLKASELIVGKLYSDIPTTDDGHTVMKFLERKEDTLYFQYVSGRESYGGNPQFDYSEGPGNYFYEVEESLIQTMQSDINSFFAIIDITVAKLKATASEIEKLKQKP